MTKAIEKVLELARRDRLPSTMQICDAERELEAIRKAAKVLLASDTSIAHFLGGYDPTAHHGLSQPWVDAVALLQSIASEGT